MAHVRDLSARQMRAIAALLTEPSISAAAEACGVGRRTLERWMREEAFRDAYRTASRRLLGDSVCRLRAASGQALTVLTKALGDRSVTVRVRAARIILEVAVRTDVDELSARVEALERFCANQDQDRSATQRLGD
jgi:hypothetical protein